MACEAIGRDPTTIRRSALIGLTEGTAWTTADEFEQLVPGVGRQRLQRVHRSTTRRTHVPACPVAEPNVADELLADVIPRCVGISISQQGVGDGARGCA